MMLMLFSLEKIYQHDACCSYNEYNEHEGIALEEYLIRRAVLQQYKCEPVHLEAYLHENGCYDSSASEHPYRCYC